jgi:predicted transcriptional regulator
MKSQVYSHQDLVRIAQFTPDDLVRIRECRQDHTRLGFAYQLAYVRLYRRFPSQQPLEIDDEIVTYVSLQLDTPSSAIRTYQEQRRTIVTHQQELRGYLGVRRFGEAELDTLEAYLFDEAFRLEQTGPLLTQAKQLLQEQSILYPSDEVLRRLVVKRRQAAREHIYERIAQALVQSTMAKLDGLLVTYDAYFTPLHTLKKPPGRPSPAAILRLTTKLELIRETETLDIDLLWLNNNYQRSLARYVRHRSASRLKRLKSERRYAVLVCFLHQLYADTIDFLIEMHDKLMTGVYSRAENKIAKEMNRRRRAINRSLTTFRTLGTIVLDDSIDDRQLRRILFQQVDKEALSKQVSEVDKWLTDKHSHVFHQVTQRYTYLRQFAPALLQAIELQSDTDTEPSVVKAVALLREMNQAGKRKLPEDAPLGFMPKKVRALVEKDGIVSKRDWECALLTAVRDEIRIGNVAAQSSKRFGRFDNFFIANEQWATRRKEFFQRAGLPVKPQDVPAYLTIRLNQVYDDFLASLPENTYAAVDDKGWVLSTDSAEKPDKKTEK